MALARCEGCGCPQGLKQDYPHFHCSILNGRRLLCGSASCVRQAAVWLTEKEEHEYLAGQRTFRVANHRKEVQIT